MLQSRILVKRHCCLLLLQIEGLMHLGEDKTIQHYYLIFLLLPKLELLHED